MAKRRILNELTLTKIAAVDYPCQEHALAAIIKSKNHSGDEPGKKAGTSGGPDNTEILMSVITKALGLPDNASEETVAAELAKRDAVAKAATDATTAAAAKLAEVEKALAEQAIFVAMSDVEKAFHADLKKSDAPAAEAFLKMSADDKKKKMKDDNDGDETMKMAGVTVSKRAVGETAFAVMKAQQEQIDKQAASILKAEEAALEGTIKADIAKNFSHVAGTEAEKVALLKAINALPEAVQKAQRAIMLSNEALAKAAFTMTGQGGGAEPEAGTAEAEVEKRASEIAKAKGVSLAKARVELVDTGEYSTIMKRAAQ